MAAGQGGGGGGGSSQCLPMEELVEAMLSNSKALAEALAAERARLEEADRVQRESWEAAQRLQRIVEELRAAAREKDAEMESLRAESADASKKLQADASMRGMWEAAYVELLLGANQKLAELRDADLGDSRTCAETPNSKQDYAPSLLKSKEVEPAQATEAAIKLQQSVDELKVLAQKKDDEIGRLQAEVVGAKRDLQKMYSLVKEKDDAIQRLKSRYPESVQKLIKDITGTHKKSRSGDPALTVRDKLKNTNLGQTVEDYISETKTVEKDGRDETTQKRRSASSMSNDDEKSGSGEDDAGQIGSDEDGDKQSGSHEDGEGSSNDEDGDEESSSDEDSDEESTSDEDEHKQSGSDEEIMNNPVEKHPGNSKRKRYACSAQIANGKNQNKRNGVTKTSKHPPKLLRRRRLVTVLGKKCMVSTGNWAQFVSDVKDSLADQPGKLKEFVQLLCNPHSCTIGVGPLARTMAVLLDGHPALIDRFNLFLPNNCKITLEIMEEEYPDEQPCQRGVPQPRRRLPSASASESESAAAAAVLIKPKEEEQ